MKQAEILKFIGQMVKVTYWDHTDFRDLELDKIGEPTICEIYGVLECLAEEPVPYLCVRNEKDSLNQIAGSLILLGDVIAVEKT